MTVSLIVYAGGFVTLFMSMFAAVHVMDCVERFTKNKKKAG
jgi:hypothetical protein